jgi:hypothetical protein
MTKDKLIIEKQAELLAKYREYSILTIREGVSTADEWHRCSELKTQIEELESELSTLQAEEEEKDDKITEDFLLRHGFVRKHMDSEHWFRKDTKKFSFITNDIGKNGYSKKLEFVFVELRDMGNEIYRAKTQNELKTIYLLLSGLNLTYKE